MKYEMKPLFEQRMRALLGDETDFSDFNKIVHSSPRSFIRCNTLKIEPDKLLARLRKKKWKVIQPFSEHPEIMLVESELGPGELGSAPEHLLGYFYVQEISSMMSAIALDAKPGELVLDVCASPGSKTTQIAAYMQNKGTLMANDIRLDRIIILSSNLERCGVANCIATKNDAVGLCERFFKEGVRFDRILLDAPCSGEGTLRSSPRTFQMWNHKMIFKLSRMQKKMIANALNCLKAGGVLVYSTCTHAPEENEGVIDFALRNFPVEIESIKLPLRCRTGVEEWDGEKFDSGLNKACRIYPQDNDSEGFFVARLRLKEEIK